MMDQDVAECTGRLDRLEVCDFKSYRGKNIIGPFKNFTAIIGPNGSGKSNVMDSISFVLGVRSAHQRGTLKELLFTSPDYRPSQASVTLYFKPTNEDEIAFSRSILSGPNDTCTSEYYVDGQPTEYDDYVERLANYNILVEAQNFLVFQGDIENVAQMQPEQLTALFEHISGSITYKQEYEELQQRHAELEERMSSLHTIRKAIAQEKRQRREQKEEAEKAQALQSELDAAKARLCLWQAYHLEQDEAVVKAQIEEAEAELEGLTARREEAEGDLSTARQAQASQAKERLLLERSIARQRAELERLDPHALRAREERARLERRVRAGERAVEEGEARAEEERRRAADVEAQLAELEEAARRQVEDEAGEGGGRLELSGELLDEYRAVKAELSARTGRLELERAAAEAAAGAAAEGRRIALEGLRGLERRLEELDAELQATEKRREELAAGLERAAEALEQQAVRREEVVKAKEEVENQRVALTAALDSASASLREARAERKEGERERRLREALARMEARVPGFRGAVPALAEVAQPRLKLALAVAMGRDLDAVVVEGEQAAVECVRACKEERVGPLTFLPMHGLRGEALDESLRGLGGTARLAVDCLVLKDDALRGVFQAILGNTIVCDTLEEARRVAHGTPGVRRRVVTLDGTLIARSGALTGGSTAGLEERARRWDERALEEARRRHREAEAALAALPPPRELAQELHRADVALGGLRAQAAYDRGRAAEEATKAADLGAQRRALEAERAERLPRLRALEAAEERPRGEAARLRRRIEALEDEAFAGLSARLGLPSLRGREREAARRAEEAARLGAGLAAQTAKLRRQLEFLRRGEGERAAREAREGLAVDERALRERAAVGEAERAGLEGARARLDAAQRESDALKRGLDALEGAVRLAREAAAGLGRQAAQWTQTLAARRAAGADLARRARELEEGAALDARELEEGAAPDARELEEGAAPDAPAPREAAAGRRRGPGRAARSRRAEAREEEEPEERTGAPSPRRFDYSQLSAEERAADAGRRAAAERALRARSSGLEAQLARLAPNARAAEQLEAAAARERAHAAGAEAARRELGEVGAALERVGGARLERFLATFEAAAGRVDAVFKALTRSAAHPLGGQAGLSLESSEAPWDAGVRFSAMPPSKRFRELAALSGGEKSVAALALLFALHAARPAPFFVMDEVDAALDAANVARVAAFVRGGTEAGGAAGLPPFQGLVVSLKDALYGRADALVGVCRSRGARASVALALDLGAYAE